MRNKFEISPNCCFNAFLLRSIRLWSARRWWKIDWQLISSTESSLRNVIFHQIEMSRFSRSSKSQVSRWIVRTTRKASWKKLLLLTFWRYKFVISLFACPWSRLHHVLFQIIFCDFRERSDDHSDPSQIQSLRVSGFPLNRSQHRKKLFLMNSQPVSAQFSRDIKFKLTENKLQA